MRYLVKAKAAIGTIRQWKDGKYIKDNEHHWKLMENLVHAKAKEAGVSSDHPEAKLLHSMASSALEHIKAHPNPSKEDLDHHLDSFDHGEYKNFDGLKHVTKNLVSDYVKKHKATSPEKKESKIGSLAKPKSSGSLRKKSQESGGEKIKWGFDLTSISSDNWKKVLKMIGAPAKPLDEHETWVWRGEHATIFTSNDPITGADIDGKRRDETGYAGYIGMEGDQDVVRRVAKVIRDKAEYIKDESPNESRFIHGKR